MSGVMTSLRPARAFWALPALVLAAAAPSLAGRHSAPVKTAPTCCAPKAAKPAAQAGSAGCAVQPGADRGACCAMKPGAHQAGCPAGKAGCCEKKAGAAMAACCADSAGCCTAETAPEAVRAAAPRTAAADAACEVTGKPRRRCCASKACPQPPCCARGSSTAGRVVS